MELKDTVWNALTSDSELQALFGGTVRIHNTRAEPNALMPYMVYRVVEMPRDPWLVVESELNIDLYGRTDTQTNLLTIERRVREMLDYRYKDDFRFFHTGSQDIPEDERYVWHINMVFNVRHLQTWRLENATGL